MQLQLVCVVMIGLTAQTAEKCHIRHLTCMKVCSLQAASRISEYPIMISQYHALWEHYSPINDGALEKPSVEAN